MILIFPGVEKVIPHIPKDFYKYDSRFKNFTIPKSTDKIFNTLFFIADKNLVKKKVVQNILQSGEQTSLENATVQ